MFTGQAGCFCCSDPPDPPPPCEVCEACTGDTPGDCQDRICPSFVIEVEGFANTTTAQNCAGFTATGTTCDRYNGTFVLEPTQDPCVFHSAPFEATVPVHFEFNGELCYECLNNESVYYALAFSGTPEFPATLSVELSIVRVSDGIGFARAHTGSQSTRESPNIAKIPHNICHEEPLEQWASDSFHPARFVTYAADAVGAIAFEFRLIRYGQAHANNGEFLGGTTVVVGDGLTPVYPRVVDDCGSVLTEFLDYPPDYPQTIIFSPKWVCCKDEAWDCDFVRDELAKGTKHTQQIPYLRVTSIRCGT